MSVVWVSMFFYLKWIVSSWPFVICLLLAVLFSREKKLLRYIPIYLYLAQFIWGENLWDPYPHNFLGYFWSYRQCVIAVTSALHCLQLFLSITKKIDRCLYERPLSSLQASFEPLVSCSKGLHCAVTQNLFWNSLAMMTKKCDLMNCVQQS